MTDEYLEGIMRKTTNNNEPAPQCRELGGCVAPEMCQELGRCTSTTPHAADTAGPADAGSPDLVERLRIQAGADHGDGAEDSLLWKAASSIEQLEKQVRTAEALAKANQEDAEKYRLLRMNTGKEYNVSTYGVPHALRITFDANGCEKYLPDGTLNFPKTLDAILDDERKIRSTWTHSAARGAKP